MSFLKNKKVLLYLTIYTILIFGSGLLIGKSANHHKKDRWQKNGNKKVHNMMMNRITKKLELSNEQEAQFKVIVDEHKVSIKEIRKEFKTKMKTMKDQKVKEINAILTPEQQEKFNKMIEKHDHKKKSKYKRNHH